MSNWQKMAENGLKITKICSKMPKKDVELYSKILKIRCTPPSLIKTHPDDTNKEGVLNKGLLK